MKTYADYGIEIPNGKRRGQIKVVCPNCPPTRTNRHDTSLSVNLDKGIWHCHYCDWKGVVDEPNRRHRKQSS